MSVSVGENERRLDRSPGRSNAHSTLTTATLTLTDTPTLTPPQPLGWGKGWVYWAWFLREDGCMKIYKRWMSCHVNDFHLEGWFLKFRFDPDVVSTIKAVVPGQYREWSSKNREWFIYDQYWEQLESVLVRDGHLIIREEDV